MATNKGPFTVKSVPAGAAYPGKVRWEIWYEGQSYLTGGQHPVRRKEMLLIKDFLNRGLK